jgi:hypothetical protein
MQPATTLHGRLLCASNCAYSATATGPLPQPPAQPFYDGAGFLNTPAAFVAGIENVDAAVVGTTADGVVVAFRGTLPINQVSLDTLLDWFNDFDALPVAGVGLPGQVHQGFLRSLDNVWNGVRDEVKRQQAAAGTDTPILVTGHSKGGGLAPLAAWRLSNGEGFDVQTVTIAAPRPGNADFAEAYANSRIPHIRYEYADDIVPHLPPIGLLTNVLAVLAARDPRFAKFNTLAYESVGTLRFIDWSGQIGGDTSTLPLHRVIKLLTVIGKGEEGVIVDDHRIGCGMGYTNALCPEVCRGVPAATGASPS